MCDKGGGREWRDEALRGGGGGGKVYGLHMYVGWEREEEEQEKGRWRADNMDKVESEKVEAKSRLGKCGG